MEKGKEITNVGTRLLMAGADLDGGFVDDIGEFGGGADSYVGESCGNIDSDRIYSYESMISAALKKAGGRESMRWSLLTNHLGSLPYLCAQRPLYFRYGDKLKSSSFSGELFPQNPHIRNLLSADYRKGKGRLGEILMYLNENRAMEIPVRQFIMDGETFGVVQAAERTLDGGPDETNYDAIWVRDTAWAYFGMVEDKSKDAALIAKTILKYFSTPGQLKRFKNVIKNPSLVANNPAKPGNKMNAPHIRFTIKNTAGSYSFDDVYEKGVPQEWNHVQNDALGLFLATLFDGIERGIIDPKKFSKDEWAALGSFVPYFTRISFYDFEDSGAWEEIRRKNTSSIGIVTHALEVLNEILYEGGKNSSLKSFAGLFRANVPEEFKKYHSNEALKTLVDSGYRTVRKQIRLGGESPDYPVKSPRYRTSDAALLNLIYPAGLKKLTSKEKAEIVGLTDPLVRERGVIRYSDDNYQCANSWFKKSGPQYVDFSDRMNERNLQCRTIPESEPQWFFDSWLSKVYGSLYRETKDDIYLHKETHFLNRALSQVTPEWMPLAGDGKPVRPVACPESYNLIVLDDGSRHFVPSPITPLNWAKASLKLAIMESLAR